MIMGRLPLASHFFFAGAFAAGAFAAAFLAISPGAGSGTVYSASGPESIQAMTASRPS